MSRESKLGKNNKLLLYRCAIKSIWTYGIQYMESHIQKVESLRVKILRINAPWCVRNEDIRKSLNIPSVQEEIICLTNKRKARIDIRTNPLTRNCYDETIRRLKRKHPKDLLQL